jgi:plasmid maintenance system killer protein
VEVLFRSAKFAKTCSTQAAMVRTFGPATARRLEARLAELEAATVLEDLRTLPQARAHELTGDRDEQISLDLDHPRRLVITVANDPIPRKSDGGLDWTAITSVVVEEVADTHG